MEGKKFTGAPFGVQTVRFDVSGIHPKIRTPGGFTDTPHIKKFTTEEPFLGFTQYRWKIGPGMYHPDQGGFHPKAVEERASGPGWAREYEVECMAAIPHLLHKDQWEERRNLRRKLGPGTYNNKDFLQLLNEKPGSVRGICDVRADRFGHDRGFVNPGPGTYGKGGIPHTAIEEKAKRSTSTKGMLETHSTAFQQPSLGCHLGPGTYNFRSFSADLLNKMTSIRGPYDVFSGDRNKPISIGHLAAPKQTHLGPGQYDLKSGLDDWSGHDKKYKGKFGTVAQYPWPPTERIFNSCLAQCPREQGFPGPGAYEAKQMTKDYNQKRPGFLSSADRVDRRALRFFTGNFNPVGPGRYDIHKFEESRHQNGHQSVFKSKTERSNFNADKYKDRIASRNVPPAERSNLIPAEGLPSVDKPRHLYTFQRAVTAA